MSTDLTGSIHGQLQVLTRNEARNKKVFWGVKCLSCTREYELSSSDIKKNTWGCGECARKNTPKGSDSIYWRGGKHISSIFLSNVKYGAKKRNIECHVTLEDLDALWEKQDGKCAYTGLDLKLSEGCTASLDRIDSSIGYTPENVQFLHKNVNVMKWALSEEEFFLFITQIYNYKVRDNDYSIYKE
jgi:hypothetical protein